MSSSALIDDDLLEAIDREFGEANARDRNASGHQGSSLRDRIAQARSDDYVQDDSEEEVEEGSEEDDDGESEEASEEEREEEDEEEREDEESNMEVDESSEEEPAGQSLNNFSQQRSGTFPSQQFHPVGQPQISFGNPRLGFNQPRSMHPPVAYNNSRTAPFAYNTPQMAPSSYNTPPMTSFAYNTPGMAAPSQSSGLNVVSLKEHPEVIAAQQARAAGLDVEVATKNVVRAGHSQFYGPPGHQVEGRYSGGVERWGVNSIPQRVPENSLTAAAKKKRGLKSNKDGHVPKRATGVTDPENMAIMHMYDNLHYNWQKCANLINEDRVSRGKDPTLTANSCTNRYNRTAPILYAIEGRTFVPLSKRKKGFIPNGMQAEDKMAFTAEMEALLVDCVQEVEQSKWRRVAELFNERSGLEITASVAANRYKVI